MRFDRETHADRMMKNYAKKKAAKVGAKAAGTAAKAGFQAAKWLIVTIASSVGAPVLLCIFGLLILLCILPGLIGASSLGMDNKFPDGKLVETAGTSTWEDNAEAALDARQAQLSKGLFWTDMKTFFTTGHWGTAQSTFKKTFKTEEANADDYVTEYNPENGEYETKTEIDPDTGEEVPVSISSGYFSSSNRLIAIIDEAFRASLRDDTKVMKAAKKMAEDNQSDYEKTAKTNYPKTDYADDYRLDYSVEKDEDIENDHFIYEACYVVAAASLAVNEDDDYDNGVKDALDYAFDLTGLDDKGEEQEIVWESVVTPSYETREEEYIKGYRYVDAAGNETDAEDPDGHSEPVYGIRYIVTITATYKAALKGTFKDIVNDKCGLEDLPDNAVSYDISTKSLANTNAIELMKFYRTGGSASLGDVGLPLPSHSYTISSPFGDRELNGATEDHGGVDLAAPKDTPIYAVKDGTCQVSGHDSSYGNCVTITHEGGVKTRYAHMSAAIVSDGEEVVAGQIIGYVGSTGNSTGNHLHFEVINESGQRVDPMQTEIGTLIEENKNG